MTGLEQVLGYLKLPRKVLGGVAIAALALLLLPELVVEWLGLDWIRREFRALLGIALLASIALLVAGAVGDFLAEKADERKRATLNNERVDLLKRETEVAAAAEAGKRDAEERHEAEKRERAAQDMAAKIEAGKDFLRKMTDPERSICTRFIREERRTLWLSAESGVVNELLRRGVLRVASNAGHLDMDSGDWSLYFTMNDWAWDYLHEHKELLAAEKPDERAGARRRR